LHSSKVWIQVVIKLVRIHDTDLTFLQIGVCIGNQAFQIMQKCCSKKENSFFITMLKLYIIIYYFGRHPSGSRIRIRIPGPTESGSVILLCCYPCMVVISELEVDAARSLLEIADSAARWLADRCCPITLISGGGSSCSMSRRI
jgi:hypothetical protein